MIPFKLRTVSVILIVVASAPIMTSGAVLDVGEHSPRHSPVDGVADQHTDSLMPNSETRSPPNRPAEVIQQSDENEPNENRTTATRISSTNVSGVVNTTDDEDWFMFTVEGGQEVTVTLSKPVQEGSIEMRLFTAEAQVAHGTVTDEQATGAVADTTGSPMRYYVRLTGEQQTTTNYTLDVQTRSVEEFEPNENRDEATNVSPNTTVTGEITANDEDWFVLTAPAAHRIGVNITKETGEETHLTASLFTATKRVNRVSLLDSDREGVVADTVGQQAVYYVRLAGQENRDTGNYEVTFDTRPTDTFEPNDVDADAAELNANDTISGEITANDEDWFVFTAPSAHRVAATVQKQSGSDTSLSVSLFTPTGRVSQNQITDRGTQAVVADTSGGQTVYFVRIAGLQQRDTSAYNLTTSARATDTFEPNERSTDAVPIEGNESISGEITENDHDWFVFTAPPDRRVATTVSKAATADSNLGVSLFTSPSTGFLQSETSIDEARISASDTQGLVTDTSGERTVYFLRVTGQQQIDTSEYTLQTTLQPTDTFEPNEQSSEAFEVNANGTATGEISGNDEDWFTFTAPATQRVSATLTKGTGSDSDLDLALFTATSVADGSAISSTALSDQDTAGVVTDTTGKQKVYFVRVNGRQAGDTSAYTLTTETRATDAFEPNQNREEATFLTVGDPTSGEITSNDEDWFQFPVTAGESVTVNISKQTGEGSTTEVSVYTPENQINETRLSNTEAQSAVTYRAKFDTVHYIRITTEQEIGPTQYNLSITKSNQMEVPLGNPSPEPSPSISPRLESRTLSPSSHNSIWGAVRD